MLKERHERRQAHDRRVREILAKRAEERAAAMAADRLSFENEEAEEAYCARMHRVINDSWKARGWIPWVD